MNKLMVAATMLILLLISCGEKERVVEVPVPTDCPPSAPRSVYSINLDGTVQICWWANLEGDVEGYAVYRGEDFYGDYAYIGTVIDDGVSLEFCFEDLDTEYGTQFYYAVTAYDEGGLESDLSYEEVTGTPRPEGALSLEDYAAHPMSSGYDLSSLSNAVQRWDYPTTDIYYAGSPEIGVLMTDRIGYVDLQDYGYVGDFDAINYAPLEGWSPSHSVEAIVDHCYIVRLLEPDGYHYAKLYVTAASAASVDFLWAYQTAPGIRDLAPAVPDDATPSFTAISTSDSRESTTDLAEGSAIPPIVERVARTRDEESAQRTTE